MHRLLGMGLNGDSDQMIPKVMANLTDLETFNNNEVMSLKPKGRESKESESVGGMQASIDDLKATQDKLTDSLKGVDTKFDLQDTRMTHLYNRTLKLDITNKYLPSSVEVFGEQTQVAEHKIS